MTLLKNPLNAVRTAAERLAPPKPALATQQKPAVAPQQKPAVATQPSLGAAAQRFALARNTSAFEGQVKDFSKVLGTKAPAQTAAAQETVAAAAARNGDDAKVDNAYDYITQTINGPDALATTLESGDLSTEQKQELLKRLATSEEGAHVFQGVAAQHPRNRAYDNQQLISSALGDAYRSGAITDEDLGKLYENLGPDGSKDFTASLALDPQNVSAGGLVEAYGKQAAAAGDKDTAAIAFSSSQELIDRNLQTPEAQRDAFERVKSYADDTKGIADERDIAGAPRADFTVALGNLARLSANGNGFSQDEFKDYVADLGDTLTNEAIARSLQVPGDDQVGGPLELFGKVSEDLADEQDDDGDRQDWKVNAALSFTASKELVNANLNTPERAQDAFHTLNTELEDNYDDAKIANKEGYSLLKYPALVEGAANLFEKKGPEIIDQALSAGGNPEELKNFLRETAFSPYSDNGAKQRIQNVVSDYIGDTLKDAPEDESGPRGRKVGTLLGTLQIAAQEGVNRAGDDGLSEAERENFIKDTARGFISTVVGAAASAAGPEAGLVSSVVTDPLLKQLIPDTDPEALRQQYEEQFRHELEEDGVDTQQGQKTLELFERAYDTLIEQAEDRGADPDRLQDIRDTLGQGYENVVQPWLIEETGR